MKTCKTCKHYHNPGILGLFEGLFNWDGEYSKCRRPEYYRVNPVNGKQYHRAVYCETERRYSADNKYCGPDGDFWESK